MRDTLEIGRIWKYDSNIPIISEWMHDWWGKEDGWTREQTEHFIRHSCNLSGLPQTFGLFLNNVIIGMYQFSYVDLPVRPDIYPWLANLYIREDMRGKGYGRVLLESVKANALEYTDLNELFLYTKYEGLYEKFGWEYVGEIDTYTKQGHKQRLYKLNLK